MKDSGIKWIGSIPDDWDVCRVKDKYIMFTGFTPDTSNDSYYDSDGYVWVNVGDINENYYVSDSSSKISQVYIDGCKPKIVKQGSLLYSFKLSVGKVAFAAKDLYINEAIAAFIDIPGVCLNYLYYSSFLIQYNANTNIYGAKLLNSTLIKNSKIIVPPLNEQKRIANYLDSCCGRIKDIKTTLAREIDKLEDYRKSIITKIVINGMHPNVNKKLSGLDYIKYIPETWKLSKIKYKYYVNKDTLNEDTDFDYEIKYIDISSVNSRGEVTNKQDLLFGKSPSRARRVVKSGDTIISTVRTYLRAIAYIENAEDNLICSTGFAVLTPKSYNMNAYLTYLITSDPFIDEIVSRSFGVNYPAIRSTELANLSIPLPPLEEQKEIVEYLDKKCKQIDDMIDIKKQQIETLDKYKNSLIYEYVTGKKRVK